MVDELCELHGITRGKIAQIGKVQMDLFKGEAAIDPRDRLLDALGVPSDHKLVTFGTNTTGLKEHEVSIARHVAGQFSAQRYGKATLFIRTHPQDENWRRDFKSLERPPWVICHSACSFGSRGDDNLTHAEDDMIGLANLMKHSDVVMQSRGSLALDAIAFDTPVISLAFDGDLERSAADSFLREYEYEHYKPLVSAEGTWMVGSFDALDRAVQTYLDDPSVHAEGRRRIREDHLDPLDGRASARLVDWMVESAELARSGALPEGDWDYSGLGDTGWAARQECDVAGFVDN